ncbi:MAG TPA: carboxypeptidase-like regulatory domain-containing protein [Blastocatellia bacterium]|nr:carboxypeptidase-like regulatory domain-containing protein [Blastocatellia bacterium]
MRRHGLAVVITAQLLTVSTAVLHAQSHNPPAAAPPAVQDKQAAIAKPQAARDSIKGRVVGESNRPIIGASIVAAPINLASNPQTMMFSLLRSIRSDAEGKFEVTGLPPGVYTIFAASPGYVLSESDASMFHRPGETVTLTLVKGGVITGRVTNSSSEPVIAASVRAIRIRGIDNKPERASRGRVAELAGDSLTTILGGFTTDDRGIYRIYGLTPGYYQIAAGGRGGRGFAGAESAYASDAPTYFPSSTIDTAGEVTVRAGDEATGIDIRYRDLSGHSISGRVLKSGTSGPAAYSIVLTRTNSEIVEATTFVPDSTEKGFVLDAVLDGEYSVTAMGYGPTVGALGVPSASVSRPWRVTVNGGDVTGVELSLEPLASIAGRAVIEPLRDATLNTGCKSDRLPSLEEIVISAPAEIKPKPEDQVLTFFSAFKETTPSEKGEFTLGFLRAGAHRLALQLPSEVLYIKSAILPAASTNAKPVDVAKNGVALKSGDKIIGLVVTLIEGAAGLRGKVVTGEENKPRSQKMRVHLVPAEPEAVDEVLRYFEADVAPDGSFSLINLAPGKYWLVARETSEQEVDPKPLAWNSAGRMGLRFEGDALKKVIELTYCQRVADYVLKYTPLIQPSKAPAKKPAD